jgi:hypothetical protein
MVRISVSRVTKRITAAIVAASVAGWPRGTVHRRQESAHKKPQHYAVFFDEGAFRSDRDFSL